MKSLDSVGSVCTAFVDFRRTFDLVDHNVLFDKLKQTTFVVWLIPIKPSTEGSC